MLLALTVGCFLGASLVLWLKSGAVTATAAEVITSPGNDVEYLKVPYVLQGKHYITIVPFDSLMAAQGWRVTLPNGDHIPFHPGAISAVPAALFGVKEVTVRWGGNKPYTTTMLAGVPGRV